MVPSEAFSARRAGGARDPHVDLWTVTAMIPKRDAKPLEYAALLPMFGGMEKKPRYIERDVVTRGGPRGSDFCLDGNEVSALHCLIYKAADGYRVRDCGSRTGTRVNGQGVKTAGL